MPAAGSSDKVRVDIEGPIATITNANVDKQNAFDDEMDARLWEILDELKGRPDLRAVIWRAEGKSWSSGRDVSTIGTLTRAASHHELMSTGHRGIQRLWDIEAPVIVAIQGWAIGGSFQRALLCDIRIAAEDARFALPEVTYGVIPDTGGVGVLYQMCGHGLVSDMVLTGRRLSADEALGHGIVSRVVPRDELDATAREMAERIAAAPAATVKMARRVIARLAQPEQRAAMGDELIYQTFVNKSDDYAEMRGGAGGEPVAEVPRELRARAMAQELADRIDIDDLLTRYATAVDTRDWDLYQTVFTADAVIDYTSSGGIRGGLAEVTKWLSEVLSGFSMSQHLVTNRDIRIAGDTATSRSYFYNPMGRTKRDGSLALMFVGGYYRDQLRRTGGGWRIAERIQDTAWFSSSPGGAGAPGPP